MKEHLLASKAKDHSDDWIVLRQRIRQGALLDIGTTEERELYKLLNQTDYSNAEKVASSLSCFLKDLNTALFEWTYGIAEQLKIHKGAEAEVVFSMEALRIWNLKAAQMSADSPEALIILNDLFRENSRALSRQELRVHCSHLSNNPRSVYDSFCQEMMAESKDQALILFKQFLTQHRCRLALCGEYLQVYPRLIEVHFGSEFSEKLLRESFKGITAYAKCQAILEEKIRQK